MLDSETDKTRQDKTRKICTTIFYFNQITPNHAMTVPITVKVTFLCYSFFSSMFFLCLECQLSS